MKRLFTKLLFVVFAIVLCLPFAAEAEKTRNETYKNKSIVKPLNAPLFIWPVKIEFENKRIINNNAFFKELKPDYYERPERNAFDFCLQNKTGKKIIAYEFNFKLVDAFGYQTENKTFVSKGDRPINANSCLRVGWIDSNPQKAIHGDLLKTAKSFEFKVIKVVYEDGTVENF